MSARLARAMPSGTCSEDLWRLPRGSACRKSHLEDQPMKPLPTIDLHDPPVRVMALHALAYCKRLFYLEEVEEIRVADDRVFAGRQLHAALAADDEDGE